MSDSSLPLLGGEDSLVSADGGGVYARFPATQLKYNTSWQNGLETQARLRLVSSSSTKDILARFNETEKPYVKAALENGYVDFLLQTANESVTEKVQTVEFLSDAYAAYFFGQRPPIFQYSGTLFNTQQDDWWVGFWFLYTQALRGTRLADLGMTCRLQYDSRLITGAMLDFSTNYSADLQMAVNFHFSILVKEIAVLPVVTDGSVRTPTQPKTEGVTVKRARVAEVEEINAPMTRMWNAAPPLAELPPLEIMQAVSAPQTPVATPTVPDLSTLLVGG